MVWVRVVLENGVGLLGCLVVGLLGLLSLLCCDVVMCWYGCMMWCVCVCSIQLV